jgi:hypothetical protein
MIAAPEILMERARDHVGLSDLGPDGWQEGLDRLVDAVASGIDDDAAARIEAIIVGRLTTRLRVEAWYAAHAAEAAHPVEQPLVIVGLPRTGTTAIHHLLAIDPRFRFLRSWEVSDPIPPAERVDDACDPRRAREAPRADVRHITAVDGPVEDGPILGLDFRVAELVLPVPDYTAWWRETGHATAFAYHERILRMVHASRRSTRWLLKYPAYLFQLRDVVARYPTARFVMTHRDPVAALPSTCSTILDSREKRLPGRPTDRAVLGSQMLEHWSDGMRRALEARDELGEPRFVDVGQHEIEVDPIGAAARVCDFAGLRLPDDVRGRMAEWAADNRRGSRGEHRYRAAEFGLTDQEIRSGFGEYRERFGRYCTPSTDRTVGGQSGVGIPIATEITRDPFGPAFMAWSTPVITTQSPGRRSRTSSSSIKWVHPSTTKIRSIAFVWCIVPDVVAVSASS